MCIGECSKGPVGRLVVSGPTPGLNGVGSSVVNVEVSGMQGCRKAVGQSGGSNVSSKKAIIRTDSSVSEREEDSEYEESLSSLGSRDPVSIQVVPETQLESDRGIDLMVDLRNQGDKVEKQNSVKEGMTVEELSGLVPENQQQEATPQDSDARCKSGELKKSMSKSSRGGPVKEEFQMEAHLNFNPVKESGCDMAEKERVVIPFSSNAFGEANTFAVVDSILIGNRGKEKEKQEIGGGFHKRRSDKDDGLKRSVNSSCLKKGGERSTSEFFFKKGQAKGNRVYVGKPNLRHCFDYMGKDMLVLEKERAVYTRSRSETPESDCSRKGYDEGGSGLFSPDGGLHMGGPGQLLKKHVYEQPNSKVAIKCEKLTRKAGSMVSGLSVASPGISKRKRGRQSLVSLKGHSMILRSFKACEKVKLQNSGLNNKVMWNLEDEVAKVLEKGIALVFNFHGKEKELSEIISRREEVNDNRFRDLVRCVIEVSKEDFKACTTEHAIVRKNIGPSTFVELNCPGNHYYICDYQQSCLKGMKLNITVNNKPYLHETLTNGDAEYSCPSRWIRILGTVCAGLIIVVTFALVG
ncbi:hypothetical protein EZV62_006045 [Acer yangbiense]|uniref:Phytocyanin domain-containing protein n=1 Tax=Acer yangbiense TaxID=1000413 RepID=A0A5C7IPD2_9ROSI|nr:hypothetical protein EZV62_006045 [Acer yangbiense]